jgi:hypothetical protein
MPNKTDRARINQKYRLEEKAAFVAHIQQKLRQTRRTVRSGYAFSQQEGWGPLITSGRMQAKGPSRVRPSHIVNVSTMKNLFFQIMCFKIFFPKNLYEL